MTTAFIAVVLALSPPARPTLHSHVTRHANLVAPRTPVITMVATTDLGPDDNLYAMLGVAPTASNREVRKAFRRQASKLHPDVNSSPDAEVRFRRLAAAAEILSDDARRAEWNFSCAHHGHRASRQYAYERPSTPLHEESWARVLLTLLFCIGQCWGTWLCFLYTVSNL